VGSMYLVYDKRDRLVMTQDALQRTSNKWLLTKYDVVNRPVIAAVYTHGSSVDQVGMSGLISTVNFFESYTGAVATHGYSSTVWPTSGYTVLTVTYYDNYRFVTDLSLGAAYSFAATDITGQEPVANARVVGQVTGSKVNVLNSANYLWNVSYYDAKYRVIQSISQNRKAGTIRTTNVVDFPGRVTTTKRIYLVNGLTTNIKEIYTYDEASRLRTVKHSTNGAADVMIAKNEYNELSQLIDKKLHSTDFTNFKQSVDYRYNIRGWLTSINNASLITDATNDDATDYFGMSLSYNTVDPDISNGVLFNGNIAAMKWSNYPGTGTIKQKAYTYTYDAMNRIDSSTFKEKTTFWAAAANSGFAETGYSYDLNGNIKTMQRNDRRGSGWMDNMTYNYGTGSTQSNRLLKVEDTGDDFAGFIDGNPGTTEDYTYDANGNLTHDLNKGIGTSLIDPTNIITYNFLNLPETVTKGGNTVTYVYDATGRKLTQVVTFGASQKQTDYVGEFTYENDALQHISHEEGRVVMFATKLMYTNSFDILSTDLTAVGSTTVVAFSNNGQKYVSIKSNNTTSGNGVLILPGGSSFNAAAGDRYKVRVKGYSGSNVVYLQVKARTTLLGNTNLPNNQANEGWVEQIVTIPVGATTMQVGLVWGTTVALNEVFYINEFEITKLEATSPEYQYNLKDHLGNVRLTFTTKTPTALSYKAGFETVNQTAESNIFTGSYPPNGEINTQSVNATTGSNSELLNGGYSGRVGVAKSFSVMPGDQVQIQAYAKYTTPSGTPADYSTFVASLLSAFNLSAPAVGEVGTPSSGVNYFGNWELGSNGNINNGDPVKVFVTIFLFDKNYNLIDAAYDVSTSSGALMSKSYTVREPGYAYLYVSNEHPNLLDVYIDDVTMTHTPSPIIKMDDYYPFGLTYNSYSRENSLPNRIKFQGQEHVDDLGLNWDSFKWRNHQPDIGRFFNIDPLAEKYYYNSPYAFSENKVVTHIELEGLEAVLNPQSWGPNSLNQLGTTVSSKQALENFNNPSTALSLIKENKNFINESSEKYCVSSQLIGSIIFQEKTAGVRGDIKNVIGEIVKQNDPTLSLGLGEMQIAKAAELKGLDPKNLSAEQKDGLVAALKDPKQSIELIAMNIKDMQNFIGRELTVQEATFGHNAGKDALKTEFEKGCIDGNRVSKRSADYQQQISTALQ
jgi:RHS repeat-associated protein